MSRRYSHHDDYLQHWGLKKGEKASTHKYVAREDTGKKTPAGATKYRYYYDMKDLVGRQKEDTKIAKESKAKKPSKLKQLFKNFDFMGSTASGLAAVSKKAKVATRPVSTISYSVVKGIAKVVDKVIAKMQTTSMKKLAKSITNAGKAFVDNWRVGMGKSSRDPNSTKSPLSPTALAATAAEKVKKYVAKVRTATGKIRYFYDKAQYARYSRIQQYQTNEPSFMKKVKKIEPSERGKMPSIVDDLVCANDPKAGKNRTINCLYCSTAFELRNRGYDVEAIDKPSGVRNMAVFENFYETSDGTPILQESKTNSSGFEPNQHTAICTKETVKSYKALEASATQFPANSRGTIMVQWNGGGGHAFNWVKDASGTLMFIDSQVNKVHSADYMDRMLRITSSDQPIIMVRTDDLKLKKGAMDICQDRKGDWYGQDNTSIVSYD